MYKNNKQMSIDDFIFPYGDLNPENEWIKLSMIIPWEEIEEKYAAKFVNNGHPAHPGIQHEWHWEHYLLSKD